MSEQAMEAVMSEVTTMMTAEELAKALRVSRSWVYEAARNGGIPCLRVGALLRFDLDEVKSSLRGIPSPPAKIVGLR
jgi:excisionase family DNA binding protein